MSKQEKEIVKAALKSHEEQIRDLTTIIIRLKDQVDVLTSLINATHHGRIH